MIPLFAMSSLFSSFSDSAQSAAAASRGTSTSSAHCAAKLKASSAPASTTCRRASTCRRQPRSVAVAAFMSLTSSLHARLIRGGSPPSVTMAGRRASSAARLQMA